MSRRSPNRPWKDDHSAVHFYKCADDANDISEGRDLSGLTDVALVGHRSDLIIFFILRVSVSCLHMHHVVQSRGPQLFDYE